MNPELLEAYIAEIEAQLGRELRGVELASVRVSLQEKIDSGEIDPYDDLSRRPYASPTAGPTPASVDVAVVEAVIDQALAPAVISKINDQLTTAREALFALPDPRPAAPAANVADMYADEDDVRSHMFNGITAAQANYIDQEAINARREAGLPMKDFDQRPYIGDLNGVPMVWSEEEGGPVPGFFFDRADSQEGPLPIWASYLGITEPGKQLPTNLAEIAEAEQDFADRVTAWVAEGRAEAEAFGLGPEYTAPGAAPVRMVPELELGTPQYMPGDNWIDFATKSPEYQTLIQHKLVEANLMNESDIVDGMWTIDAAKGMEIAMGMANSTGGRDTWVEVIEGLAAGGAGDRPSGSGARYARPRLVIPSYMEPDYDLIEQQVKQAFTSQLNRKPTDWEITLLAEKLNNSYREQYDAEVEALKAEYAAGNRVLSGGVAQAESVQGVDPIASLTSQIEDRYVAEIGFNEDRSIRKQEVGNVFAILNATQDVLGGGAQ